MIFFMRKRVLVRFQDACKSLYRAVFGFIHKKIAEPRIRRFDENAPAFRGRGSLNDSGGSLFFSGYLDKKRLTVLVDNIFASAIFDKYGMWQSRDIPDDIALLAAEVIGGFKAEIVSYLGEDARLDDFYLFCFDPVKSEENCISGGWHNDNVGYRMKIFVCLEGDGSVPTLYVPGTNRSLYRFNLKEALRFSGVL